MSLQLCIESSRFRFSAVMSADRISILQWDIDEPEGGGGRVTIRNSVSQNFIGFSELKDGAIIEAVNRVHATLFTIALSNVDYNGTFVKFM